jgi:surface antigen
VVFFEYSLEILAQGLRLLNDNGVSYFDTSKTTWNFVKYLVAPEGTDISWEVPEMNNFTDIIISTQLLDALWGGQENYVHTVSRSGDTITATGGAIATAILILGR